MKEKNIKNKEEEKKNNNNKRKGNGKYLRHVVCSEVALLGHDSGPRKRVIE
jgi:hypothetical protein